MSGAESVCEEKLGCQALQPETHSFRSSIREKAISLHAVQFIVSRACAHISTITTSSSSPHPIMPHPTSRQRDTILASEDPDRLIYSSGLSLPSFKKEIATMNAARHKQEFMCSQNGVNSKRSSETKLWGSVSCPVRSCGHRRPSYTPPQRFIRISGPP